MTLLPSSSSSSSSSVFFSFFFFFFIWFLGREKSLACFKLFLLFDGVDFVRFRENEGRNFDRIFVR